MRKPETKLERHVAKWLREYNDDPQGTYDDLMYGGCQSGIVGHLIYYTDTVKFYKKHREEIDRLLGDMCDDTGMTPSELFGDKWERDDPLARDTMNQNLLAWFGFEETARNLMED